MIGCCMALFMMKELLGSFMPDRVYKTSPIIIRDDSLAYKWSLVINQYM